MLRSGERYGMIEIGSSGVKVNAYSFTRQMVIDDETKAANPSGRERAAPAQVGKGYTVNTNPITGKLKDVDETVRVVVEAVTRLGGSEFGVPRGNIAIVASSGVAGINTLFEELGDPRARSSDARSQTILDALSAKITRATSYTLDSVDPATEAKLSFDWTVLSHRRQQVLLIDIGSGNTKGGYYEQVGTPQQRFRDFSVPLGTKSFAKAIRDKWPTDPVIAHAQSIFDGQFLPDLNGDIESAPGLLNKPRVYFSGGIFWATSVLMRPKEIAQKQPWVQLTTKDFEGLGKLINENNFNANVKNIPLPPSQAEHLANEVTKVAEAFNPDQLAAGNALCRALSSRLSFETRSKLFFASFSVDAWSSQYLLNKFGEVGDA